MAVVNSGVGTLSDLAKLMNEGSPVRRVAELASAESELLQALPMSPANGDNGHLVAFDTALPVPTWTKHNQGVTPSKGSTDVYTETFGRAEMRFAVAKSLTERNGGDMLKSNTVRQSVLGMKQEVTANVLYASSAANPERFYGLIPRLDSLSGSWQKQIVNFNSGASGNDQASILVMVPGEDKVHLIYPPGTPAGLSYTKLPDDYEDDGSGGKVLSERGHFVWRVGVAVEDARYLVRIGNIDMSAISASADTLINALIDAMEKLPTTKGAVIFMPRTLRAYLRKQQIYKSSPITVAEVAGKGRVTMFDEAPIYVDDNMLLTESTIGA